MPPRAFHASVARGLFVLAGARLGPADLDSAGFSAVGRSSWVLGRGPYFTKFGPSSSLVTQKRKLRGSFGRFARRVLFGWLLNEDKLVLAQDTSLDLLGFSLCTTALDIGATARRLRKLKAAVAGALARPARVRVRSLCSICGQIQSMQLAYGIKCRIRSRHLLLAVRLALADSPDYGAFVAPGARALEELALWGADIDTSARQPMHVHLRRPEAVCVERAWYGFLIDPFSGSFEKKVATSVPTRAAHYHLAQTRPSATLESTWPSSHPATFCSF